MNTVELWSLMFNDRPIGSLDVFQISVLFNDSQLSSLRELNFEKVKCYVTRNFLSERINARIY